MQEKQRQLRSFQKLLAYAFTIPLVFVVSAIFPTKRPDIGGHQVTPTAATEVKATADPIKARQLQTLAEAKIAGLALVMYANDHNDTFPPSATVEELLSPYVKKLSVSDSASDDREKTTSIEWHTDGKALKDIAYPGRTIIASKIGPGGKANIYADGIVMWQNDRVEKHK